MTRVMVPTRTILAWPATILTLILLSACASVSPEQNSSRINDEAAAFTGGQLALALTDEERSRRIKTALALLERPLSQTDAVQLALVNSPSMQALLAQGWAESANAAQAGRISNPVFSFEHVATGDELELSRALSFGLLDLLTLPKRQGIASRLIEQSQLRLTGVVVDQVTQIRQAWVRAVAAQQSLTYAQQVYASAEASAHLARRMQAAGNFNRISRAREQAFYADAATSLASATHRATAAREALARLLGLDEAQTRTLQLPERLPDLPREPLTPETIGSQATRGRLDIRLAQTELDAAAKAQGLNSITSLTDIELAVRRDTVFDNVEGTRSNPRGYEVDVRLPIFDWGDMQRNAMNARTLAAANQLEATMRIAGSSLREGYSTYRTAFDIARHYRDEVIPLRRIIADENLLRYNGMIIGVFELLADAREQITVVMAAIDAEQQFWLADAALQATLIGRPTSTTLTATTGASSASGDGH